MGLDLLGTSFTFGRLLLILVVEPLRRNPVHRHRHQADFHPTVIHQIDFFNVTLYNEAHGTFYKY